MDDLEDFVESLLRFDTTEKREAEAQAWLRDRFEEFGFETYEWEADAERLVEHPSFPNDPDELDVDDRPSVAGVVEFGDPAAGRTLVLNGHVDVVPAEPDLWSGDPFEPEWSGDHLYARGAADMKAGLAACVFAVRDLRDAVEAGEISVDGRVVVESVVGEEEGGIGAAAAALDNPYPFERDAAVVAEPTDMTVVTATEGTVMKRLQLKGRSAHAATKWAGVDVLDLFEQVREKFYELEADRSDRVTHPLYESFETPWPIVFGTVEAGSWSSTVPANLTSEIRIGVAPGESVEEAEAEYEMALLELDLEEEFRPTAPPSFERFSVQFEPAEIDADEPVVRALQTAMAEHDYEDTEPRGATYGADSRLYVEAGIPTVVFGPGRVENAHFPDEAVYWPDVEGARETLATTALTFLAD